MLPTNTLELSSNKTPFQMALQRGCVLTLIECLDVVDCNEFIDGKSPLMIAIEYQHSDVVQLLIDEGAHVNAVNKEGNTPLHMAIALGNKHLVKLLLTAGADVNGVDSEEASPLWKAANLQLKSIVKLLLSNGARLASKQKEITPEAVGTLFNVISDNSSITQLHFDPKPFERLQKSQIRSLLSRNMYLDNLKTKAIQLSTAIFDDLDEISDASTTKLKYQPSIIVLNASIELITKAIEQINDIETEIKHCCHHAEQFDLVHSTNNRLKNLLSMAGALLVEMTRPQSGPGFFASNKQSPQESIPYTIGFNA